jgi:hypothetical protein
MEVNMSTNKPPVKRPLPSSPKPEAQKSKPPQAEIKPPVPVPAQPAPEKSKPLLAPTLDSIFQELQSLKHLVDTHSGLIAQLQETLARKRKPVASNGKVQIRDKQTGKVYPSKNNAYQTLLKSGDLKSLVDKGLFGDVPEKQTFGWYTLVREWPDRFEEVPAEQQQA